MTIRMERQIHDKLKCALHNTVQEEEEAHFGSMAVYLAQEKSGRRRIGFYSFIKRQVRFIRWRVWFLQGAMLFGLYEIFVSLFGGYFQRNIRYMALFLCCLTVLLTMSAGPILYRSIRYAMYEIEIASRFSVIKLLLAKILAIGIGNFIWLGAVLMVTVVNSALQMESALLYIVFSYLAAGGCFLYLLGHVPAQNLLGGSIGIGFGLLCLLFLLKACCPDFFGQTFSIGWGCVCAALLLFCIKQIHYFLYRSAYAQVNIV